MQSEAERAGEKSFQAGSRSAPVPAVVPRPCPMCGANAPEELIRVDPEFFCPVNSTFDQAALRSSGMLELPHLPVSRCRQCRFVYVSETLSPQWQEIFWTQVYLPEKSKEKIRLFGMRRHKSGLWHKLYSYRLAPTPYETRTIRVLDFGAGWGDFVAIAQSEGVSAVGIEISPPKLDYARAQHLDFRTDCRELTSELKFDVFFSDQVFEHLEARKEMLREIAPLLDRDFVGYIGVPDYSDQRLQTTIADAKARRGHDKDFVPWDHLNYFSPESLWDFLSAAGFEVFSPQTRRALARSELRNGEAFFRYPRPSSAVIRSSHRVGALVRFRRSIRAARAAWRNSVHRDDEPS